MSPLRGRYKYKMLKELAEAYAEYLEATEKNREVEIEGKVEHFKGDFDGFMMHLIDKYNIQEIINEIK